MTEPTPLVEQYARTICQSRGVDPDGSVTIGYPDGSTAVFDPAWSGYVDLSEALLALHEPEV